MKHHAPHFSLIMINTFNTNRFNGAESFCEIGKDCTVELLDLKWED